MAAGLLGRLSQHRVGRWIRRFWIPLTAAAAVSLIVAVCGNASAVRVAPAWVVGRGAARTADAVESRISASPYQALSMFGSALMAGSLECEFTYFDSYSDGFGQVRLVTDLEHHRLSFGGEAMVNGQHVDGEIFLSDQRAADVYKRQVSYSVSPVPAMHPGRPPSACERIPGLFQRPGSNLGVSYASS